jgi:hypothetical protein
MDISKSNQSLDKGERSNLFINILYNAISTHYMQLCWCNCLHHVESVREPHYYEMHSVVTKVQKIVNYHNLKYCNF